MCQPLMIYYGIAWSLYASMFKHKTVVWNISCSFWKVLLGDVKFEQLLGCCNDVSFDLINYDWRRELMTVFVYFFLVILFFGMYTEYLWKSPLDKALQFLFIKLVHRKEANS